MRDDLYSQAIMLSSSKRIESTESQMPTQNLKLRLVLGDPGAVIKRPISMVSMVIITTISTITMGIIRYRCL